MTAFVEHLHEVFADFGPISAKRMFGGWGVYHDGLMFALVVDDTLYLKADAEDLDAFTALGLGPFEHRTKDRVTRMPYYRAPDGIIDDRAQAAHWARQSASIIVPTSRSGGMRSQGFQP